MFKRRNRVIHEGSLHRLLRLLRPQLHQQIHQRIGTEGEKSHDGRIPPAIIVLLQIQRLQVIAPHRILAHLAPTRRIRVHQVRSRAGTAKVVRQIAPAGLTLRGIEYGELVLRAFDFGVPDGECEQAAHEVVEGIEVVDPVAPEGLDLTVGNQDSTEGDERADYDRVDERGEDGVGGVGGDELPDAGVHEFVHEHHEEDTRK